MILQNYEARVYYIASLVRIVASEDIECICKCIQHYKKDEIEEVADEDIYETYCKCSKSGDENDGEYNI